MCLLFAAVEKILNRLKVVEPPMCPPSLVPIKAPVIGVNHSILNEKQTLLYALRADFNAITEFARSVKNKISGLMHSGPTLMPSGICHVIWKKYNILLIKSLFTNEWLFLNNAWQTGSQYSKFSLKIILERAVGLN